MEFGVKSALSLLQVSSHKKANAANVPSITIDNHDS